LFLFINFTVKQITIRYYRCENIQAGATRLFLCLIATTIYQLPLNNRVLFIYLFLTQSIVYFKLFYCQFLFPPSRKKDGSGGSPVGWLFGQRATSAQPAAPYAWLLGIRGICPNTN